MATYSWLEEEEDTEGGSSDNKIEEMTSVEVIGNFLNHIGLSRNTTLTLKDGRTLKMYLNDTEKTDNALSQFFTNLSAGYLQSIHMLSSNYPQCQGSVDNVRRISKKDVLYSVCSCCDPFLLKDVFSKLHALGYAVPIVTTSIEDRKIVKYFPCAVDSLLNCVLANNSNIDDEGIFPSNILKVSAIRFGDLLFSKSEIVNKVLVSMENNDGVPCFLGMKEDPYKSYWSKGTIELRSQIIRQIDKTQNFSSVVQLNLRGDGSQFQLQKEFCERISDVMIVFLADISRNKNVKIVQELVNTLHVIVVTGGSGLTVRNTRKISSRKDTTIFYLDKLGIDKVSNAIADILKRKLRRNANRESPARFFLKTCSNLDIKVDEAYEMTRSPASSIITLISSNPTRSSFENIFPLQNRSSKDQSLHEWSEDGIASRQKRNDYSQKSSSGVVDEFIRLMSSSSDKLKETFLLHLDVLLQDYSHSMLKNKIEEYSNKTKEMKKKYERKKSNSQEEQKRNFNYVTSYEQECLEHFRKHLLRTENFICEVWQRLQNQNTDLSNDSISPDLCEKWMKEMVLNGHSIDLINFDHYHSPTAWIECILTGLQSFLGHNVSTRVVSVFGGIETRSFALINHMFGTSFNEYESMLPGGLRMQLVPVKSTKGTPLGFEYLLLFSIQPIKLLEMTTQGYSERRSLISSVVSSITNVLILHIDWDCLEEEKTILFDIFVHSMLNNAPNPFYEVCFVYSMSNAKSCSQRTLERSTAQKLKESCGKIDEKGIAPLMKDHICEHSLYRKVCHILESRCSFWQILHSVEISRSIQLNQEYVESVGHFKKYLLKKLTDCQERSLHFSEVSKIIATCVAQAISKVKSSPDTTCYRWNNASYNAILQHFEKAIRIVQLKIEQRSKIGTCEIEDSRLEDIVDTLDSVQRKINNFAKEEFEILNKQLMVTADINESVSEKCKDLSLHLRSHLDKVIWRCTKLAEKAAGIGREKTKIHNIVKTEARNTLLQYKKEMVITINATLRDEEDNTHFMRKCLDYLHEKYPVRPKSHTFEMVRSRIVNELQKAKYGNEVNTMGKTIPLTDCYVTFQSMLSMKHVKYWQRPFYSTDVNDERILEECCQVIEQLSSDYTQFESNAVTAAYLFGYYSENLQGVVDRATLIAFFCVKYISKTHNHHVMADLRLRKNSQQVGSISAYEAKHVEPLKFSTRISKTKYVLNRVRTLFKEPTLSEFTATLLSDNCLNYEHIPFDLLTLQRVDRRFLRLLPKTSSQNMIHILEIVNDIKIQLLGETLARTSHNLTALLEGVFGSIKNSAISGPNRDKIRGASFYHVASWASEIISLKECNNQIESNVACRIEKLFPYFQLETKAMRCEPVEEDLAKIVCDDIEKVLRKCIAHELGLKITEHVTEKMQVLLLKKSFIGTMLHSFCRDDDFLNLICFVENFENCSRKWGLRFIAKIMNEGKNSVIHQIVSNIIDGWIRKALSAVKTTASVCLKNNVGNVESWVKKFQNSFFKVTKQKCLEEFFPFLFDVYGRNCDINLISSCCYNWLNKLKPKLNNSIEVPEEGNVDATKTWLLSLPGDIFTTILDSVVGCVEQCPYCGNVCQFPLAVHNFHATLNHIPLCIKGGVDEATNKLITSTCYPLVSRNRILESTDGDSEVIELLRTWERSYLDFKLSDSSGEPTVFWKYISHRFNRELSDYHECTEGQIPLEWKLVSKEEALKSVEMTYYL